MNHYKNNFYFQKFFLFCEYFVKGLPNLSTNENSRFGELARAAEAWEINEFPMPLNPTLVELLTYLMKQLNLSQTEFASKLEISGSLLSEILNGKRKPNLDIAKQLHSKFQIDGNLILESL